MITGPEVLKDFSLLFPHISREQLHAQMLCTQTSPVPCINIGCLCAQREITVRGIIHICQDHLNTVEPCHAKTGLKRDLLGNKGWIRGCFMGVSELKGITYFLRDKFSYI